MSRLVSNIGTSPSVVEVRIALALPGSDDVLDSLKLPDRRRVHERVKLPIAREPERVMFVDRSVGVDVGELRQAAAMGGRS